jgi:hypothetical protein
MKMTFVILVLSGCLFSCSIFRHNPDLHDPADSYNFEPHTSCPPAAFGAEKILAYQDKQDKIKKPTAKGDPITGKKTSQAKGIRTGELEKPPKLTKDQKRELRRKRKEERALKRQIDRDAKLAKNQQAY